MKLYVPSNEEATALLQQPGATRFRGLHVATEALPPPMLWQRALAANDGGRCMPRLICDEISATIVGSIALKPFTEEGRIELGYGIAPLCRGQGHATVAVRLLVKEVFASDIAPEVFANVAVSNPASRRVLEKAGFSFQRTYATDKGVMERWNRLR